MHFDVYEWNMCAFTYLLVRRKHLYSIQFVFNPNSISCIHVALAMRNHNILFHITCSFYLPTERDKLHTRPACCDFSVTHTLWPEMHNILPPIASGSLSSIVWLLHRIATDKTYCPVSWCIRSSKSIISSLVFVKAYYGFSAASSPRECIISCDVCGSLPFLV